MRTERTGPVQRLTPRLERFFAEALRGVALDDLQDAQARKADCACLNGLLAIELKSLDEDASERMDNLTDELRDRPDWPLSLRARDRRRFLGARMLAVARQRLTAAGISSSQPSSVSSPSGVGAAQEEPPTRLAPMVWSAAETILRVTCCPTRR